MNNQNQRPLKRFRQKRRLRREYVLASKVNRNELEAINDMAGKQGRTISGLIRHLLNVELQRTV
jgi:hypothetical protein